MAPIFSKVVRSIPLPRRSSSGSKERERVGRRKALLIGINYQWGEAHEYFGRLQGSIHDVQGLKGVLIRHFGFEEADIVVMTDEKLEDRASDAWPSKDNIVAQMQSLVQDAQSEDVFVFHYAGHTDQREVPSPEDHHEEDGMDEILISSDFQHIVDDDLRKHLVDPLPTGSRLTAIFDSCHSGTMLDLPHYRCNSFRAERRDSLPVAPTSPEDELSVMALRTRSKRRARTVATEAELKQRGKPIVKAKFTKFKAVVRAIMMMKSARSRVKSSAIMPYTKIRQSVSAAHPASPSHKCGPRCRLEIKAVPTVISISACEDHQRSWEVDFDGDGSESTHSASSVSSNGSMTKALINILENTPSISVEHMHLKLSDHLWQDAFAKQTFAIRFIKQHGSKYTKKQIEKMKEDLEFDVQTPQIGSLAPLRGDEVFIVGRRDVRAPSTFGFVPRLIKNM